MDPTVLTGGGIALAALVIHVFLRLLKSDTLDDWLDKYSIPPLPPRAVPWLSLVAGVASSVLDVKLRGVTWTQALLEGLAAGVGAIGIHETVVESARAGREFGDPPPGSVGPSNTNAIRPPPMTPPSRLRVSLSAALVAVAMVGLTVAPHRSRVDAIVPNQAAVAETTGCGLIPAKDVPAVEHVALDIEQLACVLAQDDLGTSEPAVIAAACSIPENALQAIIDTLSAKRKAAASVARLRKAGFYDAGGGR